MKRLVAAAHESMAAGKVPEAMVLAGRILQIDPANTPTFRLVAEAEEAAGNPESFVWRERLAGMNPGSFDDLIAYAKSALVYRSASVAAQALSGADASMKARPEYLEVSGDISLRFNDRDSAEKSYAQAVGADPKNQRYAVKLASVQVQARDEATIRAGLEGFERLSKDSEHRAEALRGLVRGYASINDLDRSLSRSEELVREPNAVFGDRLLRLSALKKLARPESGKVLGELQAAAREDAAAAGLLVTWMQNQRMTLEAIAWIEKLPRDVRGKPQLGVATAACLISARDWVKLEELVKNAEWGRLGYLKSLFSARLHREKGDKVLFRGFWESALAAASTDPQMLLTLGKIAQEWGWDDLREEFLWVASEIPQLRWALQELKEKFVDATDTEKVHRLTARVVELNPADLVSKNNLAMLELLLGKNADFARRIAEKIHQADPQNNAYISTLAFALLRSSQPEQALATIQKIPRETLGEPASAWIYGLILEANDSDAEAVEFLRKSKDGKHFKQVDAMIGQALNRLSLQE